MTELTKDYKGIVWEHYPAFDEYLKILAEDALLSYKEIAFRMNERFGDLHRFTRNACLGRCARKEYGVGLRHRGNNGGGRPKSSFTREPNGRKLRVSKHAPVIRKDLQHNEHGLRDDNEPRISASGSNRRKYTRTSKEEIDTRRVGFVPDIIEEAPVTSVSLWECADDACKWPTCDDPTAPMVCGAPARVGAYCERHGRIAYREMPTVKRNASYSRRGLLNAHGRLLLHHGEDLE